MKTFLYLGLLSMVSAGTRLALDKEELLHAKQFREEALEVERGVASQLNGHYVEAAPMHEGRHLGLGLGVQFGPFGLGASTGLGWHGVGFNANAGYGDDFVSYGSPEHYSQYYNPQPQSRSWGFGIGDGFNVGPVGVGVSAGVGHGKVGLSGGFGWGDYTNYGSPRHYQQYYSRPYSGPFFHPSQLVQ